MPYQKLRNFAQLIRDHLNLGLDRGSHLPNYPVFPGHRSAQDKRKERLQHPWHHLQSSLRGGKKKPLEVWPESHWPGFTLRQSDVFQSYAAQ